MWYPFFMRQRSGTTRARRVAGVYQIRSLRRSGGQVGMIELFKDDCTFLSLFSKFGPIRWCFDRPSITSTGILALLFRQ